MEVDFAILIADDDKMIPGMLGEIYEKLQSNILFYICNMKYMRANRVGEDIVYNTREDMCLTGDVFKKIFVGDAVKPKSCMPLVPAYTGLILNLRMLNDFMSRIEKYKGTSHMYIGGVVETLLREDDMLVCILNKPSFLFQIGNEKDYAYEQGFFERFMKLYEMLPIERERDRIVDEANNITFSASGNMFNKIVMMWISNERKGIKISDFLKKSRYYNVVIYREGVLGKCLLDELRDDNFKLFLVDKNIRNFQGIYVLHPEEINDIAADCVIVTPSSDMRSIKKKMMKSTDINVLKTAEILEKCGEINEY